MTTNATTDLADINLHPFERAGLGKAPFKFAGWYESKFQAIPGDPSSCDFCSQGIMIVCRILSADGREFKVGQDCCRRTGDRKLVDALGLEKRRADKKKRDSKSADVRSELYALLADENVRNALSVLKRPNPVPGWSTEMNSLLSYVDFLAHRAGAAGRLRALKLVKEVVR